MTVTRGLLLVLTLLVAAPAAAQSRDDQRRPDPRRDDQRRDDQRPGRLDQRDSRDAWDRRAVPRFDLAFRRGLDDGYEAGLRDRRKGDRFDPVGERRYRSGDDGYDRRYGPRDLYKNRYRDGFRRGYQQGYADGRSDRRGPPWWWPFR